jgi:ornithine cyclodeaminase
MLVLTRAEVASLLDPDELIDALAPAMVDLSSGAASVPPRIAARVPEADGLLGAMPGWLPSAGVLESKLVTLFPRNTDVPTHQGLIVAFDPATGTPIALMDAEEITAQRTAAGSALATRVLARRDAAVLAVLGTGVQAAAHLRFVTRVRAFDRVVVVGRDLAKARDLAARATQELGRPVEPAPSFEEAQGLADVVCAATHTLEPIVRHGALRTGAHVNSVGLNPNGREVDAATVASALVVVESRDSALTPGPAGANDVIDPIAAGSIARDDVVEIGEILAGDRPGRTSPDQLTLYKSVGVAVQDAAAAGLVLRHARERGVGREIEL